MTAVIRFLILLPGDLLADSGVSRGSLTGRTTAARQHPHTASAGSSSGVTVLNRGPISWWIVVGWVMLGIIAS